MLYAQRIKEIQSQQLDEVLRTTEEPPRKKVRMHELLSQLLN